MEEEKYWLSFACCPGIGPVTFCGLRTYFGCAKDAWHAPETQLHASGLGPVQTEFFLEFRKTFSFAKLGEKMAKKDVSFVTRLHGYPYLLSEIARPPIGLFAKGNTKILQEKNLIAVVGTRTITSYGKSVTDMFTRDLAVAGMTIVSGLAMGVDACSHTACLNAGGKTIAVLGSGVDYCTPRENQKLYERILAQGGCIISEYPLSQAPSRGSFPARNRIIAGMSMGVLVTEGATDSGSLITARDGFKNKRPVYAVPGPITSHVSRGPHTLIAQGALMVTSASDILNSLGQRSTSSGVRSLKKGDNLDEQKILSVLRNENLSFDQLVKRTGISPVAIGSVLTLMEMKAMIQTGDDGLFCLA